MKAFLRSAFHTESNRATEAITILASPLNTWYVWSYPWVALLTYLFFLGKVSVGCGNTKSWAHLASMKWFLGACVSNLLRGLGSYEYHAICIPPALAAREWECALTCVCVLKGAKQGCAHYMCDRLGCALCAPSFVVRDCHPPTPSLPL